MKRTDQIIHSIVGILFILSALIIAKVFTLTGGTFAATFAGVMLLCYAWVKNAVIRGNVNIINIVSVDGDGRQIGQGREIDDTDIEVLVSLLNKKAHFSINSYELDSEALQIFDKKGNRYIYIDKKNRKNLRLGKLFEIKLNENEAEIFYSILNKYRC